MPDTSENNSGSYAENEVTFIEDPCGSPRLKKKVFLEIIMAVGDTFTEIKNRCEHVVILLGLTASSSLDQSLQVSRVLFAAKAK